MNTSSRFTRPTFVFAVAGVALASLLAIGAHRVATRSPVDAAAFHVRMKDVIESVPFRLGEWEGEDVPVPPSAVALLRPNVLLGRVYRRPSGRERVSLIIIQCQDTRDLAGHYPPVCYPAHGWEPATSREGLRVPGTGVAPIARYAFTRTAGLDRSGLVIYNALILPGIGPVASMDDIRDAAGNPQSRAYGAAQVQLVVPAELAEPAQVEIVTEFLNRLELIVGELSSRN